MAPASTDGGLVRRELRFDGRAAALGPVGAEVPAIDRRDLEGARFPCGQGKALSGAAALGRPLVL
eukprot:9007976-Lingulodinium_polyedra.AAC.1